MKLSPTVVRPDLSISSSAVAGRAPLPIVASSAMTSRADIRTALSKATSLAAVLWLRPRRQPRLPLPLMASPTKSFPTGVRAEFSANRGGVTGGLVRSGGPRFPSPPGTQPSRGLVRNGGPRSPSPAASTSATTFPTDVRRLCPRRRRPPRPSRGLVRGDVPRLLFPPRRLVHSNSPRPSR